MEEVINHQEEFKNSEGLPLIVWLKGDEPFFNEFSLHADQVMAMLGIKRSRLNQISGKELRVGRTRIDNYIRPVYRPEDVQVYQAWLRPTASHKKSSVILNEARQKLEEQSESLGQVFSEQMTELSRMLDQKITKTQVAQQKRENQHFGSLQKELRSVFTSLKQRHDLTQRSSAQCGVELKEVSTHLRDLHAVVNVAVEGMTKLSDLVTYQQKILLTLQEQQSRDRALLLKMETTLVEMDQQLSQKPEPFPRERICKYRRRVAAQNETFSTMPPPEILGVVRKHPLKRKRI